MASNSLFHVVEAAQLDAERDVYVGLPVETTNKQTFHRVPVRASRTEARVQLLPGSTHVVQSTQGLRRLLLKFPTSYCPGIKVYHGDGGEADRCNRTLGFALYDQRSGPTPEEVRVQQNIDRLASFIRGLLFRCERIRTTLKLGPATMAPQQQQVAAEMLDLWVARPASDDKRGRYCYTKLVTADSNAPEKFHTYFWTPDGNRIPNDVVEGYRNFQIVPFVEVEDVFVSKAVRSMQLKLRECIVYPPAVQASTRFSVCFPDRVCSSSSGAAEEAPPAPQEAPPAPQEAPEAPPAPQEAPPVPEGPESPSSSVAAVGKRSRSPSPTDEEGPAAKRAHRESSPEEGEDDDDEEED